MYGRTPETSPRTHPGHELCYQPHLVCYSAKVRTPFRRVRVQGALRDVTGEEAVVFAWHRSSQFLCVAGKIDCRFLRTLVITTHTRHFELLYVSATAQSHNDRSHGAYAADGGSAVKSGLETTWKLKLREKPTGT